MSFSQRDVATPLEIYVLTTDRSVGAIRRFLDHYMPSRAPAALEYAIPEYANNPTQILTTDAALLAYMAMHPLEHYGVYWHEQATGSSLQTAMVFYTRDGAAILGLAGYFEDAYENLQDLAAFARAKHGWLTSEERPPDTAAAFIKQCQVADQNTRITE